MRDFALFVARRVLYGLLVIVAVSAVLFSILQMMPGDAIELLGGNRVSRARIDAMRVAWGLDKPPAWQYFYWLRNLAGGNMGVSILTSQDVAKMISSRLPYTLGLTLCALLVQYLIAIPIGLIAGVNKDSWFDRASVQATVILRAMPNFWLGILLMLLFSVKLRMFPISGYSGAKSLVLPVLSIALPYIADTMRLTRAEVIETMAERHVTTARAKGLSERLILLRHVLRNSLVPVTVMFFLALPWLIGGSVVVEAVFSWPGMGRLLWRSVAQQDYPVIQGVVFVITTLTVVCNTIGDVVLSLLDPRIKGAVRN
ncbi:MAG: ABC transporter permease [Synergistaceae bacterium]|jgi:peptide/nickel transport system permease protein|nr:ABC transporter permease [Synergistaceae bacterium]